MVKKNNKKKGGKRARRGKKSAGGDQPQRQLIFAEDNQIYAKVLRLLGDCRLATLDTSGVQRTAIIPGRFRKRVWIQAHDVILLSLRDFQDDKADVIYKYQPQESRRLAQLGEIPQKFLGDRLEDTEDGADELDGQRVDFALDNDDGNNEDGDYLADLENL